MPAEGSGAGKKWYKWHFIAVTFSKSELRGELGRTRELTDSTPTLVTLCISIKDFVFFSVEIDSSLWRRRE